MIKQLLAAVAVASLGLAAGAAASDSSQNPKPKKERRICRTQIRSGSNISRTVCKTNAEWATLGDNNLEGDGMVAGNRVATGRNVDVGGVPMGTFGKPK
jgi:hypothetical protein